MSIYEAKNLAVNNFSSLQGTNPQYIVGGYLPGWKINRDTDPTTIPANKLTHLFYAFADVDSQGNVGLRGYGQDGDISFLQSLKAQNPNLKILVSIGGAKEESLGPEIPPEDEKDFSTATSTPESRAYFVQSAIKFMKDNGFDGIDIDWEFPNKEENNNYTQLLGELRTQLNNHSIADGKTYQLTTALPASPYHLSPQDYTVRPYDLKPVLKATSEYVDFINVMTYDYHDGGDNIINHQAALYPNDRGPSYNWTKSNADWGIREYLDAGVEAKDIVLGVPLYGYAWKEVKAEPNSDGLFQNGTLQPDQVSYEDLYAKAATTGYQVYWDDKAKVPYIYNSQQSEFMTYENEHSVLDKINYVEQKGLGGMFFWELTGDLAINHPDSLVNFASTNLMF